MIMQRESNLFYSIQESELGDEYESNTEDTGLQNTNFTFTEHDFKAGFQSKHHSNLMKAWRKMNELKGHEVECKNVADGKIVWEVVREVKRDEFISIRDIFYDSA